MNCSFFGNSDSERSVWVPRPSSVRGWNMGGVNLKRALGLRAKQDVVRLRVESVQAAIPTVVSNDCGLAVRVCESKLILFPIGVGAKCSQEHCEQVLNTYGARFFLFFYSREVSFSLQRWPKTRSCQTRPHCTWENCFRA